MVLREEINYFINKSEEEMKSEELFEDILSKACYHGNIKNRVKCALSGAGINSIYDIEHITAEQFEYIQTNLTGVQSISAWKWIYDLVMGRILIRIK